MTKVLLISLFHPELVRGGAQQVCYELFMGLKVTPGINPTLLAAVDPSFNVLYKSGARITGFDGRPDEYIYLSRDYDYWWQKTSSAILRESFVEFLEITAPDVVHFHHFLLFGVDLITLTRRVLPNCKIVFTFHEFLAICEANGQMVRRTDQSLCTKSSPVRCHQCFPDRRPEEFFMRDLWIKSHFENVDVFTTPSKFMIDLYETWGLRREMVKHVTNGQRLEPQYSSAASNQGQRNRFGFFGQLVDNKGVHVLLEAVEILRGEGFDDFFIEINGDNIKYASERRRREFEEFFAQEASKPPSDQRVRMNGSYQADNVGVLMSRVDWCIVPSTWWEIFCLVISEAWSCGIPVIASRVGGPAERVSDGKDGLLFPVGDARALARTIQRASTEVGLWDQLRKGITKPPSREAMVEGYVGLYLE